MDFFSKVGIVFNFIFNEKWIMFALGILKNTTDKLFAFL